MAYADQGPRVRTRPSWRACASQGLFKEERFIHAPAGRRHRGRVPDRRRRRKKVINLCANNYLGLSSHPEVVAAAHAGLDDRGYGMSLGALHLRHAGHPPRARAQADRVPRHRGHAALPVAAWTPTPASSRPCSTEQDVMIADRLVHASIVDGMRLCKAMHGHLQALRHGAPGGEAPGAPGQALPPDHHRRRVLDGRRPRASSTRSSRSPRSTTRWCSSTTRTPPGSSARPGAARTSTAASWASIDIITTTLGKALGGASGGCVSRARGARRDVPPAGAALPVLEHRGAA